jgi:hypothetical protein
MAEYPQERPDPQGFVVQVTAVAFVPVPVRVCCGNDGKVDLTLRGAGRGLQMSGCGILME